MNLIEQSDLMEQGRALGVDVSPGSLQDEEGYWRLAAEVKATLNARFMRGEELVSGPLALTAEEKVLLLEGVERDGIPPEGKMVFVFRAFESKEDADAWIAENEEVRH